MSMWYVMCICAEQSKKSKETQFDPWLYHQISRNSVIGLQVQEHYIGKKQPNYEALTSHKSYIPSNKS